MSNAIVARSLCPLQSVRLPEGEPMIETLEIRRTTELEKRIAKLERLVSWLAGLLIDFVAAAIAVGAAILVASDYYGLRAMDGSVFIAFTVTMLSLNFVFRKVTSWCFD
jgi:hypothetical protein